MALVYFGSCRLADAIWVGDDEAQREDIMMDVLIAAGNVRGCGIDEA